MGRRLMLGKSSSTRPTETPVAVESDAPGSTAQIQSVSVGSVLLGSGPRFARDAFGPLLSFYIGWKIGGVLVGIVVATLVAATAWVYERRHERPGMVARLSLGLVLIHAVIGLVTRSATIYLAQPLVLSGALGVAFTVSTLARRPLAGVFAVEMFPFSAEMRSSREYRQLFGRVSLAWGVYLLLHCVFLLAVLIWWGVDVFVPVNIASSAPCIAGLLTWSIWYIVTSFRRSEEWGWVLRGEPSPQGADNPT
jgi:intracellular septation protein A